MAAYSIADLDELEPRGAAGTVRFVRKALGARAFGFNWFESFLMIGAPVEGRYEPPCWG